MSDIISILEMVVEGGFTWQETITLGLAIIGCTLSVLIIVQGAVSLIGKILETVNIALQKIKPKSPSKE